MQQDILGFTFTHSNSTSTVRSNLRRLERRAEARKAGHKKHNKVVPETWCHVFNADGCRVLVTAKDYAHAPRYRKVFERASKPFLQ